MKSMSGEMSTGAGPGTRRSMSVGAKVTAVVGLCLALLLAVAGTSLWQMHQIGGEIESIAKRDIPLTEALTKITVHQLEQAIHFERAVRAGIELHSGRSEAGEEFTVAAKKFEQLATVVDGEMNAGEELAQYDIDTARTELERTEFQRVLEELKKIHTAHDRYDTMALDVFKLLRAGNIDAVRAMLPRVVPLEADLDHKLEALLFEVEAFTANAATTAEAHEKTAIRLLAVLSLAALLLAAVMSYFLISRTINRPLADVVRGLDALAAGDASVDVRVHANDEIGAVASSFVSFKESLIRSQEMEAEQQRLKEQGERERKEMLASMADDFDANVGSIVETVSAAASELQATAQSMSGIAEETSSQAIAVASASEEASTNVQTVASSAEEMSASIGVINDRVAEASQASKQAVAEVLKTSEQITALAQTAERIGEVIGLISGIAEQTNLLALNATIESARAGEAGKGFAVVANEVKTLANQTAQATGDISKQIQDIQSATTEAVASMDNVNKVIENLDQISATIASGMDEQGAATQEIARSVQEAATGTQQVNENISGVTQGSQEAGSAASQVSSRATELSQQADVLKAEVAKFTAQARAG